MSKTLLALTATLAALAAYPAGAQSAPYFSASKTEAILGGSSRLAAILAQQSGQPLPARPAILPASYGSSPRQTLLAHYRPPAASDRPDVFNSVALPIGQTSLERRWRRVSESGVAGAAGAFAARLGDLPALERLQLVNRYVNTRVRFTDDIRQYGVADRWVAAAETLRRGQGDCEDYAIAKLQMLRRAGFADEDLYLVILRDALRRADHAVLVARVDGRLLVLDNNTDRLIDSYEMPDYRPIISFSGKRAWTHGYRREAPALALASNQPETPAAGLRGTAPAPVAPSALR